GRPMGRRSPPAADAIPLAKLGRIGCSTGGRRFGIRVGSTAGIETTREPHNRLSGGARRAAGRPPGRARRRPDGRRGLRRSAGRAWPDLLAPADCGRGWDLHRDAFERTEPRPRTLALLGADGERRRMTVRGRALPEGEAGGPAAVVMLQEAMRDEEVLRAITELRTAGSDTALWSLDLRTGRLRELFGPSPLGRMLAGDARSLEDCLARVHRDDIARVRDAMEASKQGRDYEQRFRMTDRFGDERVLHAKA